MLIPSALGQPDIDQPQDKIIAVTNKPKETVVNSSIQPEIKPSEQPIIVAETGSKIEWMTAAGIPESDWYYVDCVINGCDGISPEGGWGGTEKWNTTGSGAYGLCQSLPAEKMASEGADYMTNPVTQLKWCSKHAQGYGNWKAAWEFRRCIGNCYSNAANRYVSKDHTWW